MTDRYVDSAAVGLNDGTTKADAYTTVVGLLAGAIAAGDRVFIDDGHVEGATATLNMAFPGTPASPNEIYSVDFAGSTPPVNADLSFGALVDTTLHFNLDGSFYAYGLDYRFGSGSGNYLANINDVNDGTQVYDNCIVRYQSTGAGSTWTMGVLPGGSATVNYTEWRDCQVEFGGVAQYVEVNNRFVWRNETAIAAWITASVNPTSSLFKNSGMAGAIELEGLDLSAMTGLSAIFNVADLAPGSIHTMSNCKTPSGVPLITGTRGNTSENIIRAYNSDSGDTNYTEEIDCYEGNIVTDTAQTLNASNGTTAFSLKMASSANAKFHLPLYSEWLPVWVDSTGAKTVTLEFIHDSVTKLQDDEVWIEVMYAANTGDTLYKLDRDRMGPLGTAADQAASTEAWTETLTNENKQKAVSSSITVNEKGLIYARLALAKPSYTVYLDPDPVAA